SLFIDIHEFGIMTNGLVVFHTLETSWLLSFVIMAVTSAAPWYSPTWRIKVGCEKKVRHFMP
ncbi:hypothetical protein, partial [Xylanibacter caecicola]